MHVNYYYFIYLFIYFFFFDRRGFVCIISGSVCMV